MFNAAEAHLLLNHFPVILPIAGLAVLLGGLFFRSASVLRVAFCLLMAGALFTIPTYLTGRPAEAVAKNYPDVSRRMIREHQAAGVQAFVGLGVVGLLSAGLLALSLKRRVSPLFVALLAACTIAASILVARTAHLGGEIRHEEIRDSDG